MLANGALTSTTCELDGDRFVVLSRAEDNLCCLLREMKAGFNPLQEYRPFL